MRFRLIAGDYIGRDASGKSGPKDKETGKWPPRSYKPGEVVVSDEDLATKFGTNKFQPLDQQKGGKDDEEAAPTPTGAATSPSVAPGGQVMSGLQETTSKADRTPVSGAKDTEVKPVQPALAPSAEPDDEDEDEPGTPKKAATHSTPLNHPPAPKAGETSHGTTHPGKGTGKR